MAVPKHRTSKSKRNQRKAQWKRKASFKAVRALSMAKSVLSKRSNSYIYNGKLERLLQDINQ